ncbi:MAG: MBL fold metallo-hydrolase [Desulfobacterales bacterium]|nr:MBL fold metallo-hydrolase [Desulfobacterales bacterium]
MRFSVLASGSSGNVSYVETKSSKILVDAGLSMRETVRRLEHLDVDPSQLDAIIITHEHLDHIKGAGPLARRFDLPVYINSSTLERGMKTLGKISRAIIVNAGENLRINDLKIEIFTKCHDAVDPVGLVVSHNGAKIGLATDLGRSTRLVEEHLKGCQALILEFNHDQVMLEQGDYPLFLKRRIKGPDGHLSNKQAGDLLRNIFHKNLKLVILAHLSEKNNRPNKACMEAETALRGNGVGGVEVLISNQNEPTPMIEL